MEKIEDLYFSVQTTAEKTYVGKIDYEKYGIELDTDKNGKIVIDGMGITSNLILMQDVVLIVPIRTANGVESLPVKFAEMPTGSSRVMIATAMISEINVIDPDAPIIKAIKSVEANLIVSATEADIQSSSKIISKFGKR